MKLFLAITLQLAVIWLAYWGVPIALVGAGLLAAAVIALRCRFTIHARPTLDGHPWGEL